jgi:hypothetical protein
MAYPTWAFTLLCIVLTATEAGADDRQEAEKQFRAGVSLQKVEDFESAIAAFESSLRLYRTKAAMFNLANCQRATHRYPEALATFEQLRAEFGTQLAEPMLGQVTVQIAELKNLTATLEVEVSESGAVITVDGKLIGQAPLTGPIRLALGDHELRVEFEGFEPHTVQINLAPGATVAQKFTLKQLSPAKPAGARPPALAPAPLPPAAPPSPPADGIGAEQGAPARTSVGIATTAAGVALLIGGAVTGGWALAIDRGLKDDCIDGHCPEGRASDVDRMNSLATTTDVLLAVGAVATAGGALMLWLNPSESNSGSAQRLNIAVAVDGVRTSLTHRF